MFQYVYLDLQIQELKIQSKPKDEIVEKIKELLTFMEKNLAKGLFILTGGNDLVRFTKKYGLTNQEPFKLNNIRHKYYSIPNA